MSLGPSASTARVRELLDAARLDREPLDAGGYLDLIGDVDSQPRTAAAQAMRSGLVASVYQRWWRPTFTAVLGFGATPDQEGLEAVRLLELGGAQRVLDVACGPGNFTRLFAESLIGDGFVVGLDASKAMLDRAVTDNAVPRAGYLRADARRLPFPDGSFDAVCCYAALYLVPEPFTVLVEMLRVLAPGGRIALMTSQRPAREPLRTASSAVGWVSGLRLFDRDELTGLLRASGLVDVRRRSSGFAQFISARRPPA